MSRQAFLIPRASALTPSAITSPQLIETIKSMMSRQAFLIPRASALTPSAITSPQRPPKKSLPFRVTLCVTLPPSTSPAERYSAHVFRSHPGRSVKYSKKGLGMFASRTDSMLPPKHLVAWSTTA
eukprot:CAMPEP_0183485224 /NCGR_PEP_ID=MMETSP0370-20130417/179320_1 /TAXON_ID=268820 /ORGANISM="Peridinium aciculiferum, Strain PAER-2" /LENGTH=124 /DNA_ID=CAMNT_0025678521 /DNA_START=297 /DNA_END=671 /DNA_ORIENTATION=+